MKNCMRVGVVILASVVAYADDVSIRQALSNVVASVDKNELCLFDIGEIGGQSICRHDSYRALSYAVSNDWQNIISHVGSIATNHTERCLLLGVGFQYGWEFHLPFFTKIVDECLAGNISSNEVAWFEAYSTKPGLVEQLYYRNTDPAVTNLLHRLIQVDGDTNRWMAIMAPDAHDKVQEYIDAGILYIPE